MLSKDNARRILLWSAVIGVDFPLGAYSLHWLMGFSGGGSWDRPGIRV